MGCPPGGGRRAPPPPLLAARQAWSEGSRDRLHARSKALLRAAAAAGAAARAPHAAWAGADARLDAPAPLGDAADAAGAQLVHGLPALALAAMRGAALAAWPPAWHAVVLPRGAARAGARVRVAAAFLPTQTASARAARAAGDPFALLYTVHEAEIVRVAGARV